MSLQPIPEHRRLVHDRRSQGDQMARAGPRIEDASLCLPRLAFYGDDVQTVRGGPQERLHRMVFWQGMLLRDVAQRAEHCDDQHLRAECSGVEVLN